MVAITFVFPSSIHVFVQQFEQRQKDDGSSKNTGGDAESFGKLVHAR